ncbi:uncharacterized protein LJ206_008096 isoform 1-T1 [Theristicus caerulescens]
MQEWHQKRLRRTCYASERRGKKQTMLSIPEGSGRTGVKEKRMSTDHKQKTRIILPCEGELLKWKLIWRIYLAQAMGLQLEDLDQPSEDLLYLD